MGRMTNDEGYYRKAIEIFTEMSRKGLDSYEDTISLAMLYKATGEYKLSEETLKSTIDEYGDRYETEMYLAYLEIEVQSKRSNDSRNYSKFLEYYNRAEKLYEEQYNVGDTDVEMLALRDAYKQLTGKCTVYVNKGTYFGGMTYAFSEITEIKRDSIKILTGTFEAEQSLADVSVILMNQKVE